MSRTWKVAVSTKMSLLCSVGSNRVPKRPRIDYQGCGKPSTDMTDPGSEDRRSNRHFTSIHVLGATIWARASLVVLMDSMYLVSSIQNLDFRKLVEGHEVDLGESLLEAVDMVVTDPLCDINRVHEPRHSHHDKFSVNDVKAVVIFCRELMRPASKGHMFCTALQFAS